MSGLLRIVNNGFDLKIVVEINKLSFLGRDVRKGIFRASGGILYYNNLLVSKVVIEFTFPVDDKLGLQSM